MKLKNLDINKLKVSILDNPDDVDFANDLLERHHYLGSARLQGEQMRYVVTYRGKWVAFLYFQHVTRHSRERDKLIGWNKEQRKKRRKYMSGNARFLILEEFTGIRNLGSKCLSLVEERISDDWIRKYGHPLLALETYVDPDAGYEGSCYRGANWQELGLTKGFVLADGTRTNPKYHFIKPLHQESFKALSGAFDHPLITGTRPLQGSSNNFVIDPNKIDFVALKEALSKVTDPRSRFGKRYDLAPVLTLAVGAVLSGYSQYTQIRDWIESVPSEIRTKVWMRGDKVPSVSMLRNLFQRLDAVELEGIVSDFLIEHCSDVSKKIVSLDGKHVRATASTASEQYRFLNVIVQEIGVTIKQIHIEQGSDERREAYRAVNSLDIEGATITADAIHTCASAAKAIVKKKPHISSVSKGIILCSESSLRMSSATRKSDTPN
jgi:hypothetical protein